MKHAVLCHGLFVGASYRNETWEDLVWGRPELDRPGRLAKALAVARTLAGDSGHAVPLLIGTGASATPAGIPECEAMRDYALRRVAPGGADEKRLAEAALNARVKDTRQEIAWAAAHAVREGAGVLHIVSNPFHILRCWKTAMELAPAIEVAPHAAVTGGAAGAVVLEEPHRLDDPVLTLGPEFTRSTLAARSFRLGSNYVDFAREVDELLRTYGA